MGPTNTVILTASGGDSLPLSRGEFGLDSSVSPALRQHAGDSVGVGAGRCLGCLGLAEGATFRRSLGPGLPDWLSLNFGR